MPELGAQTYDESPGWSAITAGLDPAGRAAAVRAVTEPSRAAKLAATGYIESDAQAFGIATNKGLFAYGRQTGAAICPRAVGQRFVEQLREMIAQGPSPAQRASWSSSG